jgi:hypothetical protein
MVAFGDISAAQCRLMPKTRDLGNELRLVICEPLRSKKRKLTYPEMGSTMEFGARHRIGIGDGRPSKKTWAY